MSVTDRDVWQQSYGLCFDGSMERKPAGTESRNEITYVGRYFRIVTLDDTTNRTNQVHRTVTEHKFFVLTTERIVYAIYQVVCIDYTTEDVQFLLVRYIVRILKRDGQT